MHHLVICIVVAILDAIKERDVLFVHVGVCISREGGRRVGSEPPIRENGVDLRMGLSPRGEYIAERRAQTYRRAYKCEHDLRDLTLVGAIWICRCKNLRMLRDERVGARRKCRA